MSRSRTSSKDQGRLRRRAVLLLLGAGLVACGDGISSEAGPGTTVPGVASPTAADATVSPTAPPTTAVETAPSPVATSTTTVTTTVTTTSTTTRATTVTTTQSTPPPTSVAAPVTPPPTVASTVPGTAPRTPACPEYEYNITLPLRLCDTSWAVAVVQEELLELGYEVVVDTYFGPGTERAVRAFQADRGLAIDGLVGPRTWTAVYPPDLDRDLDGDGVVTPDELARTSPGGIGD